jgi:hypothetical protein
MNRMLPTIQVAMAIGSPTRVHNRAEIGVLVCSESDTIKILAPEPILVAFPPKPAPNTTAHHNALTFTPAASNPFRSEIMAIVTGTLSTKADKAATTHIITTPRSLGFA